MEETIIDNIYKAIEKGNLDGAKAQIRLLKVSHTEMTEFLEGIICYKHQRWGDALNHFSKVKDINPKNKRADNYISMIKDILGFFNKDLYNP